MSVLVLGKSGDDLLEVVAKALFTTGEAAEYLNVDRRTIWEETRRGRLHPIKPRTTKFYAKPDLDAYVGWRRSHRHRG